MTFDELYRKYRRHVHKVATRYANSNDVDDTTQLVWVKVHRFIPQLAEIDDVEAWLYTVTRNTANDLRKKANTYRSNVSRYVDEAEPEPQATPDEYVEAEELSEIRWREICKSLSDDQIDLFIKVRIEGERISDVARAEGVNHNTARSRMFRIMKVLDND